MRIPLAIKGKIVAQAGIADCCGDLLISQFRHDFVTCFCGKVSLDGGAEYIRIVGEPNLLRLLSVHET